MEIVICILAVLLASAIAFIFWMFKVLKNTFDIAENLADMAQGKTPRKMKEAYDGKYYPATVIAQIKFNQPHEGKIIDWSLYESKKIVGFTILTTDTMSDVYGEEITEILETGDLPDELVAELQKPLVVKNALVYAIQEDDWLWKSP